MNSNKNNNLSFGNKLSGNPPFSYLSTIKVVKPVRVMALLFKKNPKGISSQKTKFQYHPKRFPKVPEGEKKPKPIPLQKPKDNSPPLKNKKNRLRIMLPTGSNAIKTALLPD